MTMRKRNYVSRSSRLTLNLFSYTLTGIGFTVCIASIIGYWGPLVAPSTSPLCMTPDYPQYAWVAQRSIGWIQIDADRGDHGYDRRSNALITPSFGFDPRRTYPRPRLAAHANGLLRALPGWSELAGGGDSPVFTTEIAAGWPLPCLSFSIRSYNGYADEAKHVWVFSDGARRSFPDGIVTRVGIPYRLLWTPTMINACVWSLTVFGIVKLRGILSKVVRRRRGQCPKCGYVLVGLPTSICPECGNE